MLTMLDFNIAFNTFRQIRTIRSILYLLMNYYKLMHSGALFKKQNGEQIAHTMKYLIETSNEHN